MATAFTFDHVVQREDRGQRRARCCELAIPDIAKYRRAIFLERTGTLLLVDRCVPTTGDDLRDRRFTRSIIEQWFEVTWGNIVNSRPENLQMLQEAVFPVSQENADLMLAYWTFVAEK
jgi:hypothetical protein